MSDIVKVDSGIVASTEAAAEEQSVSELRELIVSAGIRMNAKRLVARSKLGRAIAPMWSGYIGEQTLFSHEMVRRELETLSEMFSEETSKPIKLEIAKCINDTVRTQMQIETVAMKLAEISGEAASKKRRSDEVRQVNVDTQVAYITTVPTPDQNLPAVS